MGGAVFLGVSATRKAKYYFSNDVNLITFDFNYLQNLATILRGGKNLGWLNALDSN